MDALIYIGKASVLISVFLCIYKLLLSRESFLQVNRLYLVLGLLLSFSLPLITFTNVEITEVEIPLQNNIVEPTIAYVEQQIPVATTPEVEAVQQPTFWEQITWYEILLSMYVLGILFFLGKLIYQSSSLLKLLHKAKKIKQNGICYFEAEQKIEAFSFFNIMAYNPNLHDKKELNIIKTHEKIHIKQWHSIDMLLGNLACIFLWFLPFVYSYRASIDENLEYIADAKTAEKTKSVKQYQYTLLNYFSLETNMQYASYFFKQSSLKNRIMMLNKEKSKAVNLYKYTFILPLIIGFIWFFQTETLAKEVYIEVEKPKSEISPVSVEIADTPKIESSEVIQQDSTSISTLDKIEVKITKNSTNKSLEELEDFFAEHDQKLKFSRIKRNRKGEITHIKIKLSDKENGFKKENFISGNQAIKDQVIIRDFKNETADITEYVAPEKELYDLLNDAKVIFVNGKKYKKNSPLAITDIAIEKVEAEVLEINAEVLEETDFGKIYKLFENDETEREVYVFKNFEGSTKNGSSLMRLEINKPKSPFAAKYKSGFGNATKVKDSTKNTSTSFYIETIPDLEDKTKKQISEKEGTQLNRKKHLLSSNKKEIERIYNKVDYVIVNNEMVNKKDIVDKILTYKNASFDNNELAFENAELKDNENHKEIVGVLTQIIKSNKKMDNEHVLWFKTTNEIELASIHHSRFTNAKIQVEDSYLLEAEEAAIVDIDYFEESKNPIYVVNGEIVDSKAFRSLDPNNIASMDVIKTYAKLSNDLKNNPFVKEEDFHGAILISLKGKEQNTLSNKQMNYGKNFSFDDLTSSINKDDNVTFVNRKVISKNEYEEFNPDEIASISVLDNFEKLPNELKKQISFTKKDDERFVLIELKDEAYYKSHFEINVQKTKDGYSMQCKQGCAWKELEFNLGKTPQYVNASGVSSVFSENRKTPKKLANLHFKITEDGNTLKLTKLEGSIWEELSFSILEGETYQLTQNGVTKK
ncbi:M56 family metallopeptidase [Psychroflexus planctonicus]|uniref:Peptidase M56 domain-containing protein n=1 Tax=Psychroflexus planctonicus TaxID=1526575 RepID=A0ABQ1SJM7_9FLAO|nr:M56 family metallopeptidase [Psychroflexus planctonicus]GGE39491.1 hypothetical protein GCM10010832_19650 [Psychroflexus planctonicus]